MIPLTQGRLDELCGVYSTINATRLIEKITWGQSHRLFHDIFRLIESRKSLSTILGNGLTANDIAYLFTNLIERQYPIKRFKPFHRVRRVALDIYWRKIQGFLSGGSSRAIIVVIEGKDWGHWTVIERATNKTLFLFDSDDRKRISRRRCTTKRMSRNRPVLLHPTMTYFLSRRD